MKVSNWRQDKKWSDKFIPEMKGIIGTHLIGEPPVEEDQCRNTDLMVLKLDTVRIACRIRRYKYLEKYGNQFTIRMVRPKGTKTELSKIIEGWGDYIFYGFCDKSEHKLVSWLIGDLKVFRLWHAQQIVKLEADLLPGIRQGNGDGSSEFVAFDLSALPPSFIVTRQIFNEMDQFV